ncbi:MAG: hypothetical protein ACR2P5_02320 [Gammaproteobacteria bacterium]
MQNNRPVENPKLEAARREIFQIYKKYDFAGAFEVISEDEAAFGYPIAASWSAIRPDPQAPLGIRLKAKSSVSGDHERLEGAAHTMCQLMDFGAQTYKWMGDLVKILQREGIVIEHTPFGGDSIDDITGIDIRKSP